MLRDILQSARRTSTVEVDGIEMTIRELSARERDIVEQRALKEDMAGLRAQVFIWSVLDEDGKPAFRQSDLAWVQENVPARIVEKVVNEVFRLSGMMQDDIEKLAGNSVEGQPA